LGSFVVVGKVGGGVGVLPAFVCIEWVTVCIFGCGGRLGFGGGNSCGIAFAEVGVAGWVFGAFRGDSGVVAVEMDFRLGMLGGVVSVSGGGLWGLSSCCCVGCSCFVLRCVSCLVWCPWVVVCRMGSGYRVWMGVYGVHGP